MRTEPDQLRLALNNSLTTANEEAQRRRRRRREEPFLEDPPRQICRPRAAWARTGPLGPVGRAVLLSERDEAQRRQRVDRVRLVERIAMEESGCDFFWSQLPPQLRWLRQPASLRLLLQRPVWLDEWMRCEVARALPLWAMLPDDIIELVLAERDRLQRLAWASAQLVTKYAVAEYAAKYVCKECCSPQARLLGQTYVTRSRVVGGTTAAPIPSWW